MQINPVTTYETEGRVAVITGAGGGLGGAMVARLAGMGAQQPDHEQGGHDAQAGEGLAEQIEQGGDRARRVAEEPHDALAEAFDSLARLNTVLIDLDRDGLLDLAIAGDFSTSRLYSAMGTMRLLFSA